MLIPAGFVWPFTEKTSRRSPLTQDKSCEVLSPVIQNRRILFEILDSLHSYMNMKVREWCPKSMMLVIFHWLKSHTSQSVFQLVFLFLAGTILAVPIDKGRNPTSEMTEDVDTTLLSSYTVNCGSYELTNECSTGGIEVSCAKGTFIMLSGAIPICQEACYCE